MYVYIHETKYDEISIKAILININIKNKNPNQDKYKSTKLRISFSL